MMIYTKKTYIQKITNEFNENLDMTYYDIEKIDLDRDYNNKLETIKQKQLPIVVDLKNSNIKAIENNIKAIESSKKESISILKVLAIIFGMITFLSFGFTGIVLYKSGLDLDKLIYPVLSFIVASIFFTVFKDKYINN